VLHEIRGPTRERKVAIVVITGAAAEQAQAAMAMGADQAVMKGATPEEVSALVDMAIETAAT
jgi:CheY-like chemotaxis protein